MDWVLAIWGAITLLSILGALSLLDMAGEFHKRGLERLERARQAQRVWRECGECGWGDFDPGYFEEIAGEDFCSLHRERV
jgi:hypothetical protein